jgi:hypothetical protein
MKPSNDQGPRDSPSRQPSSVIRVVVEQIEQFPPEEVRTVLVTINERRRVVADKMALLHH